MASGRLGHLLGEARYLAAAERTLRAASGSIGRYASGHCALLRALEEYRVPPTTMVLRGGGELLAEWQRRCTEHYSPAHPGTWRRSMQRCSIAIRNAARA